MKSSGLSSERQSLMLLASDRPFKGSTASSNLPRARDDLLESRIQAHLVFK